MGGRNKNSVKKRDAYNLHNSHSNTQFLGFLPKSHTIRICNRFWDRNPIPKLKIQIKIQEFLRVNVLYDN